MDEPPNREDRFSEITRRYAEAIKDIPDIRPRIQIETGGFGEQKRQEDIFYGKHRRNADMSEVSHAKHELKSVETQEKLTAVTFLRQTIQAGEAATPPAADTDQIKDRRQRSLGV